MTTEADNWAEYCAKPENNLAETMNFNRGKWGVAKIILKGATSVVTRVAVKKQSSEAAYNGVAYFARKYCGADFLAKLASGAVDIDIVDRVNSYDNVHGFYKDDGSKTAFVIQWR